MDMTFLSILKYYRLIYLLISTRRLKFCVILNKIHYSCFSRVEGVPKVRKRCLTIAMKTIYTYIKVQATYGKDPSKFNNKQQALH